MATVAYPEYAKRVTLSSGVTYSYTHIPAKDHKPTILFIHGFPSSSYDWRHQINYFSSLGYGVIAPDLLGYGETDRPTAAADYRGKKMAGEVNELLDHANVSKVHGVAHDWGSYLLARLNTYYRERLLSSAFLATPYRVPGKSLDVDAINAMTKEKLGFEMLGYWKFFEKEDAGDIVKEHIESIISILYPENGSVWKENMAPLGALEAFAKRNGRVPRGNYVTDEEVAIHRKIMKDEYGPAMNWYRCEMQNFNLKDEDGAGLNPNLDGPVLMAVAKGDVLSNELLINEMKQYAVNLKIVEIQSGHWIQLEKRDEVNAALKEHFEAAAKL